MFDKNLIQSMVPPKDKLLAYDFNPPPLSSPIPNSDWLQSRILNANLQMKTEKSIHSCHISATLELKKDTTVLDTLNLLNFQKLANLVESPKVPLKIPVLPLSNKAIDQGPKKDFAPYLKELKENGHGRLVEKLSAHQGYPWDEIKTIKHPIFIEQLIDLYTLCETKAAHLTPELFLFSTQKIMDFALTLVKDSTSSHLKEDPTHSHERLHLAEQLLGKLIYSTNRNLYSTVRCIRFKLSESIQNIEQAFEGAIQKLDIRLKNHDDLHSKTQLQSSEVAHQARIPLEISKILITDTGTINIGLIDLLIKKFTPSDPPLNHLINLSYGLKLFQQSAQLRDDFIKIHTPNSESMPSNHVIRATLTLPPKMQITDIHAKRTVFVALLSHLRQNKTGSCFATSLASQLLASHLRLCLKDLTHLIHESKLTRTLKGVSKDIPFIKSISDEDLEKTICLDANGQILLDNSSQTYIWESPGLQAVCLSIGIKDSKGALSIIIDELEKSPTGHVEIEIKQLIQKLCEYYKDRVDDSKRSKLDRLFNQACFAFSTQTKQPLLKVWENAIANMAETQEESMIKTHILEATAFAIQEKLSESNVHPSNLVKQLLQEIKSRLYTGIQLQYDPSLEMISDNLHGEKVRGGFVLYYKNERIDTSIEFNKFLSGLLMQTYLKFRKFNLKPDQQEDFEKFFDILTPYVNSEDFLARLLFKYHPSNAMYMTDKADKSDISFNKSRFTPWITRKGNNSKQVLEVYLEATQPIETYMIPDAKIENRLIHLLNFAQGMSEVEKNYYLKNSHRCNQLRVPGWHTGCLILLGHPLVKSILNNEYEPQEWVETFVKKKPIHEISEAVISTQTREKLNKQLSQIILPTLFTEETIHQFNEYLQKIPPSTSLKEYRNVIMNCCGQSLKNQEDLEKLTQQIDTAICQCLEPHQRQCLEESMIPLIDTNWSKDGQDTYISAMINPGTGELELWETSANKSTIRAIHQKNWMQEWEIFRAPEHLLLEDEIKAPTS